jgi:DNA-binding LacI/PurR family transcriptional regulator
MPSTKTPPTIYDVAEKAGVSITTVSRMLNAPDRVSPETRDRILAAIDQLGFVPKAEARARALRRTGRIGVITPFFTAPSFVQRLRGIAAALGKVSYELVIYPVESFGQLESYFGSIPLTGNLDGLVVVSLPISDIIARRLNSFNIPTVLIEYSHPAVNCVEIDDFEGGRMAAEYLIRKGHKHIAFLANPDIPEYAVPTLTRRFTGFRQALAEAGIELPEYYVRQASLNQEQISQATIDLLRLPCPPTAIFAALDFHAASVLKAARRLDVHIPDQLAVIGFDDLDIAEYADLTTIRQHLDESGRLAVEILLAHIADLSRPVQHVKLPLTLIERLTT